jgi:hypothetical protein
MGVVGVDGCWVDREGGWAVEECGGVKGGGGGGVA